MANIDFQNGYILGTLNRGISEQGSIGYTITFKVDSETYYVVQVEQGNSISAPPAPVPASGYFAGWKVNNTAITFPYTPTDNTTINAYITERFVPVEWIASDGYAYLDTEYTPNSNSKISITLSDVNLSPNQYYNSGIMSATTTWNNNTFNLTYQKQYDQDKSAFRWMAVPASTYFADGEAQAKATITLDNSSIIYNNTIVKSGLSTTYNNVASLLIFNNANRFGDTYYVNLGFTLYGLSIYENDVLIKDYVPMYDAELSKACLFDNVSQEPIYNIGTGDFTYG